MVLSSVYIIDIQKFSFKANVYCKFGLENSSINLEKIDFYYCNRLLRILGAS